MLVRLPALLAPAIVRPALMVLNAIPVKITWFSNQITLVDVIQDTILIPRLKHVRPAMVLAEPALDLLNRTVLLVVLALLSTQMENVVVLKAIS